MLVTSSALLRHFAAHLCDVVAHLIQEIKPSSRSARLNSDWWCRSRNGTSLSQRELDSLGDKSLDAPSQSDQEDTITMFSIQPLCAQDSGWPEVTHHAHTHTHPLRFSISQVVAQWSGAFFVQFNLTSLLNHLHYLTAFSQRELQTLSLCNFDESVHTEIKPGKSLILSGEKCLFAHTAAHNKMAASRAQTQRELSIKVKQ